jgi:hypothetical protein
VAVALMLEFLEFWWPPIVFIPLLVGFVVRMVQAAPYLCDSCNGRPYNSVAGRTCGCDHGFKRMI